MNTWWLLFQSCVLTGWIGLHFYLERKWKRRINQLRKRVALLEMQEIMYKDVLRKAGILFEVNTEEHDDGAVITGRATVPESGLKIIKH